MDEQMLTVAQVAEHMQVNPETVRRWLRSRRINGVKLGDRAGYRVSVAELERFKEAIRGKARAA